MSIKRPWRTEEKGAVIAFFRVNIRNGVVPNKAKIQECMEKHASLLEQRSWKDIKI